MRIELPKFENTSCRILTVCGELKSEQILPVKALPAEKALVARYQTAQGMALLRVWQGGESGRHLHIDCALRTFFRGEHVPKATDKKDDVLRILKKVLGAEIDVHIHAAFDVQLVELPEGGLIRSLSTAQKAADISVKLTDGTFLLTGAPVKQIHWRVRHVRQRRRALVRIEAERRTTISESYLSDSLEWINEQFLLFVLGKTKNVKH